MDGSEPEAVGVAWLPRTAVGDGDEPGRSDGAELATGLELATAEAVGDPDWAAGGDTDGGAVAVVAVGDALCAAVADGFAELSVALGLA